MLMSSQSKSGDVQKNIKGKHLALPVRTAIPWELRSYIDMRSAGGLLNSPNDRWCMGSWQATPSMLIFKKKEQVLWSCLYPAITGLEIEERSFSFGTKKTLRIERSHQQKKEVIWLVVAAIIRWERWIRQRAFPRFLTENDLLGLAKGLDATAEQLVWLFWERRHLSLDELEQLGFTQNAGEIIETVKEIVNPLAEEEFGFSLCVFLETRTDPVTNEIIRNSWWLNNPG